MPANHLPILYSFRRCPYAMRARLAIAISQQSCELREVVLRNKPPALLQASAKATVPVLVVSDVVIDESLDIMLWALRRNDPEGWLGPADGSAGSTPFEPSPQLMALIGQCDGLFKYYLDRYKYPQRHGLADGLGDRGAAAQWLLDALEPRLAEGYLSGESRGLADMAIAPFVRQYAHTNKAWFDAQSWPHLRAWLETFLRSPLFERIMEKYPPWEEGAQGAVFP